MIDKWSVIHMVVVVVIMLGQVFFLKRFFEPSASGAKLTAFA